MVWESKIDSKQNSINYFYATLKVTSQFILGRTELQQKYPEYKFSFKLRDNCIIIDQCLCFGILTVHMQRHTAE